MTCITVTNSLCCLFYEFEFVAWLTLGLVLCSICYLLLHKMFFTICSFWTLNVSYFLKLGSLIFLDIAYNGSLQQCITSSRGNTHEKSFGIKFGPKRVKIRLKIRGFFFIFSSMVHCFSFKLHRMIAWNNV